MGKRKQTVPRCGNESEQDGMKEYSVYSEFDPAKHKEKYIHYLEVVIDEDGKVHYAVPSHQEFLIRHACEKLKKTREELLEMCEKEYLLDVNMWLCKITNSISVWTTYMEYYDINIKQRETIAMLIGHGLYEGVIPRGEKNRETVRNSMREGKEPYLIEVVETFRKTVICWAEDNYEAQEIAEELCNRGDIDVERNGFDGRETICKGKAPVSETDRYDNYGW